MTAPSSGRRWSRRRLLRICVVVALLGYAAACWVAAGRLLTPERRLPRPPAEAGSLALQDVELLTDDGLRLAGWVVEPPGPARGTVLLFHGKDGCRQASRLLFLAQRGFRALAVDSRAHGASEGTWTTFGWEERRDVAAAREYARERWPDGPLVAWGRSQGAAAVLYLAAQAAGARPPFDGLILEGLYVDVDTAFANRVRRRLGGWALPLAWPVRWAVAARAGIDPGRLAPARLLRQLCVTGPGDGPPALAGVPILVAAGAEDAYATATEAKELVAAAAPGQASLVVVPGRRHEDLFRGPGTVFSTAVDGFLARFRQ